MTGCGRRWRSSLEWRWRHEDHPLAYARLLLAGFLAYVAGGLSVWWLGTSWWSVVLAIATFLLTFRSLTRPRRLSWAPAREEDSDGQPPA